MAAMTSQQFAAKWARNMQQSTTAMKDGASAVTEAPGIKAAAAQDRWAEGVMRARDNGKFAERVGSVSREAWLRAYLNKGIPRVSQGVTEAIPLVEQFAGQLLQATTASSRDVAGMDQGPGEAAKARMLRNFENMSRFRFVRR